MQAIAIGEAVRKRARLMRRRMDWWRVGAWAQQADDQNRRLMWERGLQEHALRRKERSQIISKIEARHYLRMRSHRSEGAEVANDYALQLRRAVRKSKTEKLTLHRRLRHKLLTQLQASARSPESRRLSLHPIARPPEHGQSPDSAQSAASDGEEEGSRVLVEVSSDSSGSQPTGQQLQPAAQIGQFGGSQQVWSELAHSQLRPDQQGKHFLPMLELYIQELAALKAMSPHEQRIRNLIVTMMVLAINRRQNTRLLDALDILLQTEIHFPRQNKEMRHLKSVWLALIGKTYQEIARTLHSDTRAGRWRSTRRSTLKATQQQQGKRRTIFIRSLASRKAFLDKFTENIRRSKLVYESTYMMELKNDTAAIRIEGGSRMVSSRVTPELTVFYPEPQELFPVSQKMENYAIVMVSKDKETNLFPLIYPQGLTGFVSKEDYVSKIVKINSHLIPMARCMNLHAALFLNFELLLSILITLLLAAFFLTSNASTTTVLLAICLTVLFLGVSSARMHAKGKQNLGNLKNMGQTGQLLEKCCEEWTEEYQSAQVKFILDLNCDVFIMAFPIDPDHEEDELSSFAFDRQESRLTSTSKMNQLSRKCSIKLATQRFENPMDYISEDSSDGELNEQFWKEIEAKNEVAVELEREGRVTTLTEESSDQVEESPRFLDELWAQMANGEG